MAVELKEKGRKSGLLRGVESNYNRLSTISTLGNLALLKVKSPS